MKKERCEWDRKKHEGRKCPKHKKRSVHQKAADLLGVDCGEQDEHSDRLCNALKKNRINENLLKKKMKNYTTTEQIRSQVDGDVGNVNGLTNEDFKELFDDWGIDYEEQGTTIVYKLDDDDDEEDE